MDGVALLGECAVFIVLGGDILFDGPGVAGGWEGFGFGLVTEGAGQEFLAGYGAGGRGGAGFDPGVGALAGGVAAGDHVIDVVSIAALDDGNVLVSVGDGYCIAGFKRYLVRAVLIIIRPVGHGGGLAGGGVEELVSGLVHDAGVVGYLGNLAVVADYAIVAGNAGGAGIYVVCGISRGKGLYTLKHNIVCRSAIIGRPRIIKWEIKSSIDSNIIQRNG